MSSSDSSFSAGIVSTDMGQNEKKHTLFFRFLGGGSSVTTCGGSRGTASSRGSSSTAAGPNVQEELLNIFALKSLYIVNACSS